MAVKLDWLGDAATGAHFYFMVSLVDLFPFEEQKSTKFTPPSSLG